MPAAEPMVNMGNCINMKHSGPQMKECSTKPAWRGKLISVFHCLHVAKYLFFCEMKLINILQTAFLDSL